MKPFAERSQTIKYLKQEEVARLFAKLTDKRDSLQREGLQKTIYYVQQLDDSGLQVPQASPPENVEQRIASWIGHAGQANSHCLLKSFAFC